MYIIPFSTLAIFNMLTWLEMRRALARRAQLSGLYFNPNQTVLFVQSKNRRGEGESPCRFIKVTQTQFSPKFAKNGLK